MIMLSQSQWSGHANELVFIAPQHIVSVSTTRDGERSVVMLSTGEELHVDDDRDEIVEMVETELLAIEAEK